MTKIPQMYFKIVNMPSWCGNCERFTKFILNNDYTDEYGRKAAYCTVCKWVDLFKPSKELFFDDDEVDPHPSHMDI